MFLVQKGHFSSSDTWKEMSAEPTAHAKSTGRQLASFVMIVFFTKQFADGAIMPEGHGSEDQELGHTQEEVGE